MTATRTRMLPDLRKLRPFGTHGWSVWEAGIVRSAGFPAGGLDQLVTPGLLRAADEVLSGLISEESFQDIYEQASREVSSALTKVAADRHLSKAIGWQNAPFLHVLKKLRQPADRLNSGRRADERRLAMYWQRYCGKADTIGSFGPFAWVQVNTVPGFGSFHHGPGLVASARPSFESWMVVELGNWIASRKDVATWFPPVLEPMVHLDEGNSLMLIPGQSPLRLHPEEVAVLRLADGRRSPQEIVAELTGRVPERSIHKVLEKYARKRLISRGPSIPISVEAWQILRHRVSTVGDAPLREEIDEILDRFELLLDDVMAARDDAELTVALSRLNTQFLETTGTTPTRGAGSMYAGRTLCYFDSQRDVDWTLGSEMLDSLDDALALLLRSADWFAERLQRGYAEALSELARELLETKETVRLSDLWAPSLDLFWGDNPAPLTEAIRDLSERWAGILDQFKDSCTHVQLNSADLAPAVTAAFPEVQAPASLGIHSPDLQFLASGPEAISRGEFTAVLGELHACYASLDIPAIEWSVPEGSVRGAINDVLRLRRLVPLFPESWRRNTGRVVPATSASQDRLLGFTRAVSVDRMQVWPMASLTVVEGKAGLELVGPDGEHMPLVAAWVIPISMVAADAFKVGLGGEHSPRLSIDRLVLFRETWRLNTDEIEIHTRARRANDHLVVRSWQRRNGLPDEVFVKFEHEVKPTYLHFGSVPLVASFLANIRRQRTRPDGNHRVIISECLPRPQDSWLSDQKGNRYVSEVRLQMIKNPHPQEVES